MREPVGVLLFQSLSFKADLGCFSAVICVGGLGEPGMRQGLFCCDTMLRVVYENLPQ